MVWVSEGEAALTSVRDKPGGAMTMRVGLSGDYPETATKAARPLISCCRSIYCQLHRSCLRNDYGSTSAAI
jgi:hypothetical protein